MTTFSKLMLYFSVTVGNVALCSAAPFLIPISFYEWLLRDSPDLNEPYMFFGVNAVFLPVLLFVTGVISYALIARRSKFRMVLLSIMVPVLGYGLVIPSSILLTEQLSFPSAFLKKALMFLIMPAVIFAFIQIAMYTLLFGKGHSDADLSGR